MMKKKGLAHLAVTLVGCLYLALPVYLYVRGRYLMNTDYEPVEAKKQAVVELVKSLLLGLLVIASANALLHSKHPKLAVVVILAPAVLFFLFWLSFVTKSNKFPQQQ